ncbi:MAG: DUF58 domain-containing protein [Gemmatimonadaceae bacterium]
MSAGRSLRAAVSGFAPTRRLAVWIAGLAAVWLVSADAAGFAIATACTAALALAVVLDIALLPAAHDLEVRRFLPTTVGVGEAMNGEYAVQSRWGRALVVSVHDVITSTFLASSRPLASLAISPHGVSTTALRAEGRARGLAVLGDVALRVRTPLALVARTLRYSPGDQVIVAPSLAGIRRFRWLAVHERLAAAGVRDARRRGAGRSFARLRDYVVGDDPRHIDWKATARRGHPISREFTVEQSQTLYVMVDAGRSMTQLAGNFPRFEYALSSALVLADVAGRAGDRVGAMVFDDKLRVLVPAQRGLDGLRSLRGALVTVQPSLVEPDYAAAFRALALRQRKRALVVLLTDVIDARAARTMLAHLSRGASRHLAVVVALRNDALLGAAVATETASVDALYRNAAAEELLAERATALQRMRDAGIVVLDVAPDAMAAAVVSQYLELKARGAI